MFLQNSFIQCPFIAFSLLIVVYFISDELINNILRHISQNKLLFLLLIHPIQLPSVFQFWSYWVIVSHRIIIDCSQVCKVLFHYMLILVKIFLILLSQFFILSALFYYVNHFRRCVIVKKSFGSWRSLLCLQILVIPNFPHIAIRHSIHNFSRLKCLL